MITPQKEYRNGKYFRNYREEDIKQLQMVAVLRKCLFSIEQIKTMLEHPELTADIFSEYREVLLEKSSYLQCLAERAQTIEAEMLNAPEMLARQMAGVAGPLPLPRIDIKPRFRYLDEMEESPPHVQMQTNFAEDGGHAEATRLVVGHRYGSWRHFWDIGLEMLSEKPVGMVPDHMERDSCWMRRGKAISMGLTVLLFIVFTLQLLRHPLYRTGPIFLWLGLLLAAGSIRGLLEFISWRKGRRYWV